MEEFPMTNYTMKTSEMKRNIVTFFQPMIEALPIDKKRFVADTTFGILKSKSLIVSEIARNLENDTSQTGNFKRLNRHLKTFNEYHILQAYHRQATKVIGNAPIFLVDDSDIQKPYGKVFEDLGRVRDGSAKNKNTWGNGYNVAQIVALTEHTHQPFPIAHQIYSQKEREHKSENYYTNQNIDIALSALTSDQKATFVCDRGYDDKKQMQFIQERDAHFVIRAATRRKYLIQGEKLTKAEVEARYKGRYKHQIQFQGDYYQREVMLSSCQCELLESTLGTVTLVVVFGVSEKPMLLITNKLVSTKEDIVSIFNMYFLRWRIEEYFRVIKNVYGFEHMRVQTLKRMNTLSWLLQFAMGYQAWFIELQHNNILFDKIIIEAKSYKKSVSIWLYQVSSGISKVLSYARTNLHELFGLTRSLRNSMQLQLF